MSPVRSVWRLLGVSGQLQGIVIIVVMLSVRGRHGNFTLNQGMCRGTSVNELFRLLKEATL